MPPTRFLPGADDLVIPAYVVTDANEAGLAAWKQAHPDWFVARYWTPPRRGSHLAQHRLTALAPGPPAVAAPQAMAPLEPESISLADFMAVRAAAHLALSRPAGSGQQASGYGDPEQGNGADPNVRLVQAGPPRAARGMGGRGPQTPQEEFREFRFNLALEQILRVEPRNRNTTFMGPPDRAVPSEEQVRALEAEAEAATARSRRILPDLPAERQPTPSGEILFPGGNRVGIRLGSSGPDTTTVTDAELDRLAAELTTGARRTPREGYRGTWYTRADGLQFGVRYSPKNGVTIDVNGKSYATPIDPFKIHRFPWTE